MLTKKQVVAIHGGGEFAGLSPEAFLKELASRDITLARLRQKSSWKSNLQDDLGAEYDVLSPRMPQADTPQYEAWKLWFEKVVPLLDEHVVLVGHSLGGLFLMKYLAENDFPKTIDALFCVAAPFPNDDVSLAHRAGFSLPDSLERVAAQAHTITLFHSSDDRVVPVSDLALYQKALPNANVVLLEECGHVNMEHFPELIEAIQKTST